MRITGAVLILAMLVGGWLALPSRRLRISGLLMLGVATFWSASNLYYLQLGPLGPLSIVLLWLGGVWLAVLLLLWPRPRLTSKWEIWWVRFAIVAVSSSALAVAATFDPVWHGDPAGGWWPRLGDERIHNAVLAVDGIANAVAAPWLCVLIGHRFWRAGRMERLEMVPVIVTATGVIGAAIVLSLLQARAAEVATWVWAGNNLLMLSVPLSLLVSVGVRRVQRALAVESLLRPQRDTDPEGTRHALARALGDRDLQLALWSPSRGAFLTPDGASAPAADRPSVDVAGSDGVPLARIAVDPRLADRTDLIEALADAASVTLDNARLQAEVRAGRREVLESAARLAESQDVEERLSHLLPGGVAALLRSDPEALSRTERVTATVLMSDIRGYSALAEVTDPAALAAQLNEHRRAMNDAILAEDGTVVQYVGDAVLAIFAAPVSPNHQESGLRAAEGMHLAQHRLNASWAQRGLAPFGIGIGISTGDVAIAFLGSKERSEYTVVGDTVNLAARLTDNARPAGTTIASLATIQGAAGSWDMEQLPPLTVKGRAGAVTAFRLAPRSSAAQ